MDKEDEFFIRRLKELGDRAYRKGIYLYTGFLNIAQISLFYSVERELNFAGCMLYGGHENCERKLLRFGSAEQIGYSEEFPVALLSVKPLSSKFSNELTHRDFLGAILNLKFERDTLGDIYIKENHAYVFCLENVAEPLVEELVKVKNTFVSCERLALGAADDFLEKSSFEEIVITSSSERADAIISKVCGCSRSDSAEFFHAKKIYVNSKLREEGSAPLKSGDTVSVRGFGKFTYDGVSYVNKKGKYCMKIRKYA